MLITVTAEVKDPDTHHGTKWIDVTMDYDRASGDPTFDDVMKWRRARPGLPAPHSTPPDHLAIVVYPDDEVVWVCGNGHFSNKGIGVEVECVTGEDSDVPHPNSGHNYKDPFHNGVTGSPRSKSGRVPTRHAGGKHKRLKDYKSARFFKYTVTDMDPNSNVAAHDPHIIWDGDHDDDR